jgi:hypothetical protein
MAEDVVRLLFRFVGQVLIEGLFFLTAKLLLPLLTFGWWRVKPMRDHKTVTGWHGFKLLADGTLLVDETPAMLIGMLMWAGFGGAVLSATGAFG